MLELIDISYSVIDEDKTEKNILSNISLSVDDNSFFVITGPNGGGKSTLAKILMGIATPTTGKIYFKGKDITALDITERANLGMGLAFQQPMRFKGLTIQDLLSLAAKEELDVEQACVYLAEVGLCAKDYVTRELNASLSGGELKRIEIAMLLARQPDLSIFDEPEAGIDLWSFNNLINVFQKMRSANNGSVIIISHQERILDIADKIVVIANGRVASLGDKATILPTLLEGSNTCKFLRREGQ